MFLFSTSDQILFLYSRKLLLLPLNAVHLFSVVNNQLACVLWSFATFLLLQNKTYKKKVDEWIWMYGPGFPPAISHTRKGLTLWEIKEREEVILLWHMTGFVQWLIYINLVLHLIENQLFLFSLLDFHVI